MRVFLLILVFISCSHQTLRAPSSKGRCFETLKGVTNNHLEEKEKRLAKMLENLFERMQEFEEDEFLSESKLLEQMAKVFDELGVRTEIGSVTIEDDLFKSLEIIDVDRSNTTFFREINRHLKRTDTKLSFVPKLDIFMLGEFFEKMNTVKIGYASMKGMLHNNFVDGIFKHEMMHAYFAKNRKVNPKSIFHIEYAKTGIEDYDYISMEELYTFANNVYWSLDLVRDGYFLDRKLTEINSDFKLLKSIIFTAKEITSATREISKRSIKKIQDLKSGNTRDFSARIHNGKVIIDFNDFKMARGRLPSEKLPSEKLPSEKLTSDANNKIPDEMIERFLKQDETVIELSNKVLIGLNKLEKSLENLKDLYEGYVAGVVSKEEKGYVVGLVSKEEMEKQLVLFRREARKVGEIVRGDY